MKQRFLFNPERKKNPFTNQILWFMSLYLQYNSHNTQTQSQFAM